MKMFTLLCAVALATVFSDAALAQWIWKDDAGHTVISDQPPPKSIPPARIVKTPGNARTVIVTDSAAPPSPTDGDKPKTVAEKEQDFAKRAKDAADAEKKQKDADTEAKNKADACAAVRSNLNTLQNGGRVSRVNDKGEKEYLSDDQRQADIAKAQASLSKCS